MLNRNNGNSNKMIHFFNKQLIGTHSDCGVFHGFFRRIRNIKNFIIRKKFSKIRISEANTNTERRTDLMHSRHSSSETTIFTSLDLFLVEVIGNWDIGHFWPVELERQINGGQFKTKVANGPFLMVLSWRPFAIKAADDVSATFIEYRYTWNFYA